MPTPNTRFMALTTIALTLSLLTACQSSSTSQSTSHAHHTPQDAMQAYIDAHTVDGVTHYYDPVEDRMLHLTYDYLHEGVKKKGPYHVSCADFKDQFGRKLDLDYFVVESEGSYKVTQGLLHKIDGIKRPYDLNTK